MSFLFACGLMCEKSHALSILDGNGLPSMSRHLAHGNVLLENFYSDIFEYCQEEGEPYIHTVAPEFREEWFIRGRNILESLIDESGWHWADTRTTLLLDFWHLVKPDLNYLLIYEPPWIYLDRIYQSNIKAINDAPELALHIWLIYNVVLLNFYNLHRERCILLNTHFLISDPGLFIAAINKKTGLKLKASPILTRDTSPPVSSHGMILFRALSESDPAAMELYLRMESCALLPGREADFLSLDSLFSPLDVKSILKTWSNSTTSKFSDKKKILELRLQSDQLALRCEELQKDLIDQEKCITQQTQSIHQTNSSLTEVRNQLQSIAMEKAAQSESIEQLKRKLFDSHQEYELTLLQLHQTQEELEHYFLLCQDNEEQKTLYSKDMAEKTMRIQEMESLLSDYRISLNNAKRLILKLFNNLYLGKENL